MGALRTRMIEEMKLRNFSPRTQQSYLAAVNRTGQALSSLTGPAHPRGDSRLSSASGKARFVAQFTQRGDFGDEVLLPPDAELERQAVVYCAEEAKLATARSVRPEGSRTIAVGRGKTARPLSVDDGLRHGVAGQ